MNRTSTNAPRHSAKAEIRAQVGVETRRLTETERSSASERVCHRLVRQRIWREARALLIFSPLEDEVNIWSLGMEALGEGKIVGLPRFVEEDNSYIASRVEDLGKSLATGRFGIKEPHSSLPLIPLKQLDLVLVPAVAFDLCGTRLGRGGGYYDRLLACVYGIKCGVAFDQQVVARLPMEAHDVSMDVVVTPTRWITIDQDPASA